LHSGNESSGWLRHWLPPIWNYMTLIFIMKWISWYIYAACGSTWKDKRNWGNHTCIVMGFFFINFEYYCNVFMQILLEFCTIYCLCSNYYFEWNYSTFWVNELFTHNKESLWMHFSWVTIALLFWVKNTHIWVKLLNIWV
jgi:hypothetical protein